MSPTLQVLAAGSILIILFFVSVILPERWREMRHQREVKRVSRGDEVVTVGGIVGRVLDLAEDEIVLEIGPATEVRVLRQAISHRLGSAATLKERVYAGREI